MSKETDRREAVSALFHATAEGETPPEEELWPLVYDELRVLARRQLRRSLGPEALATTGLVHEAFLRLVGDQQVSAHGRAYFFGAAARAMRQILVDQARQRQSLKRGGGVAPLTLHTADVAAEESLSAGALDLHRALDEFEQLNPRSARVVECRFFGGLSVDETAAALGVSPRTVKSDWALARAWLFRALEMSDDA